MMNSNSNISRMVLTMYGSFIKMFGLFPILLERVMMGQPSLDKLYPIGRIHMNANSAHGVVQLLAASVSLQQLPMASVLLGLLRAWLPSVNT